MCNDWDGLCPFAVCSMYRHNNEHGCRSHVAAVSDSQALEEAIDEDKPGIRECIDALAAANSMEVGSAQELSKQ